MLCSSNLFHFFVLLFDIWAIEKVTSIEKVTLVISKVISKFLYLKWVEIMKVNIMTNSLLDWLITN